MKATKRLSQTQRRRHIERRRNPDRRSTSLNMKVHQGLGHPPSELLGGPSEREVRRGRGPSLSLDSISLPTGRKQEVVVIPVPPHTFGNPQSEEFWQDMSKADLLEDAKDRNIKGRSKMTKDELVAALVAHERGENA